MFERRFNGLNLERNLKSFWQWPESSFSLCSKKILFSVYVFDLWAFWKKLKTRHIISFRHIYRFQLQDITCVLNENTQRNKNKNNNNSSVHHLSCIWNEWRKKRLQKSSVTEKMVWHRRLRRAQRTKEMNDTNITN